MPGKNDGQLQAGQLQAFWWDAGVVRYIDQRFLPHDLRIETARDAQDVVDAIASFAVDGEQCVDLFGALGVALAHFRGGSEQVVTSAAARIRTAAGSANRGSAIARVAAAEPAAALAEAQSCLTEQQDVDRAIALNAAEVLPNEGNILTHGSSGALATGGFGTATGALVAAVHAGKRLHVFVSEGRPLSTGTRLTAFELRRAGVRTTLFADSASAWIVHTENICAVLVGVAAIAANGDAVCAIGTYGIALAAAQHGIPFYLAASRTRVGSLQEPGDSVEPGTSAANGRRSAERNFPVLAGVHLADPLFDVTPGHLVTAIITEYGILRPPYDEALRTLATRPNFALLAGRGGKV